MKAALNLSISNLILETDVVVIQQELASSAPYDRHEGGLVYELRLLVRSNFAHFECVFKNRACNAATHALVDLGYVCVEGEEIISVSVPSNINVIVSADSSANK
jgi:hypothetical protein